MPETVEGRKAMSLAVSATATDMSIKRGLECANNAISVSCNTQAKRQLVMSKRQLVVQKRQLVMCVRQLVMCARKGRL